MRFTSGSVVLSENLLKSKSVSKELAKKILDPVSEEKAFNFYSDIDRPLGISASSIQEFSQRLKDLDPKSIAFHIHRNDFQKWFDDAIGDKEFAAKLSKFKNLKLPPEKMKNKIYDEVKKRMRQLVKLSVSKSGR
jgi:hypothetical protein